MIITSHAYARAGLVGNPSDGYFGKTISFTVRNFCAEVRLWESPHFEIQPGDGDLARFRTVSDFLFDQKLHGYYGGMRLIKAAIKKFHDHFIDAGESLPDRGCTIAYTTDIPRLVGLAGSSAIVVATLRALMQFHNREIPKEVLPTLALSAEADELKINAGLQDRVIQTYEGIVHMDFDRKLVESTGHGRYEPLRLPKIPLIYIAYDPARAEVSDITHRNLRELFNAGDPVVVAAMQKFRELTDAGLAALKSGDFQTLGRVMDANFDLRSSITPISPENLRMIQTARAAGASAKFAGSGGAICGLYRDDEHFQQLRTTLAALRCTVIRPRIFEP